MAKNNGTLIRWLAFSLTVLVLVSAAALASGKLMATAKDNRKRIERLEERMTKFEENQGTANSFLENIWNKIKDMKDGG